MKLGFFLSLLLIAFSGACTKKKEPSAQVKDLEKRIEAQETANTAIEERLKTAKSDEGLEIQLRSDLELAKGRLDTLQAKLLEAKKADAASEP